MHGRAHTVDTASQSWCSCCGHQVSTNAEQPPADAAMHKRGVAEWRHKKGLRETSRTLGRPRLQQIRCQSLETSSKQARLLLEHRM